MTKKWILGAILGAALVIPTGRRSHEGHAHKVLGTVSRHQRDSARLKTPDGRPSSRN